MDMAKKFGLVILSPIFIFLLFATAFDVGFVGIASHPNKVKKLVSESGLYSSLIPSVLQQTKTIETGAGTISTTDTTIVSAANKAITPQYIQQNTEAALDSVYAWLDGKTAKPEFKIDLSSAKAAFANNVAAAVQQRLVSLPACTPAQSAVLNQGGQFDAISATCLPAVVSAEQAAAQIKNSLAGGEGFLENPVFTADDIKLSPDERSEGPDLFSSKQPLYVRLKDLPKQYQEAKKTPVILSILTILVGAGIVFLSATRQKGLKHLGIVLVVIGILMMLFAWTLNREVNKQVVPKIKLDNVLLQRDIRNLATDLSEQIDKNYWLFGGLYTVVGVGAIAGATMLGRRAQPAPAADAPMTEDKPVAKPKSKAKPVDKP